MESLNNIPWLEVACAVVLLYGFVKGWSNGLVKEICSTVGFVLGCIVAYYCYKHYGLGLGWTLLICIVFPIGLGLVASLLSVIIKITPVAGTLNRLLGALLGAAKYGLLMGFLLNIIDKVEEWKNLLF